MHVLILGAKRNIMQAMLDGGHEMTVLYEPWEAVRLAPWRHQVAQWCAVDSYHSVESLLSALQHINALATPVDAVVPTGETGVVPAAILGSILGARAINIDVALRCRDKAVQKAAWRAAGVATAKCVVVPDAKECELGVTALAHAAGLSAPYIVKPVAMYGTRNVHLAASDEELQRCVEQVVSEHDSMRRLLIEQRNNGEEWHFDGIVLEGELRALHAAKYFTPLIETQKGLSQASVSYPPHMFSEVYEAVSAFTQRAVSALGLQTSVFHFEAFAEPGTFDFVAGELAARPAGSFLCHMVQKVVGVDLWAAQAQLVTGDPIGKSDVRLDRVYGQTHLPALAGRHNQVTLQNMQSSPGVVDAYQHVPFGQLMGDMKASSSICIGYALVEGLDREDCIRKITAAQQMARTINGAQAAPSASAAATQEGVSA